jgi:hypothetical protein
LNKKAAQEAKAQAALIEKEAKAARKAQVSHLSFPAQIHDAEPPLSHLPNRQTLLLTLPSEPKTSNAKRLRSKHRL